MSQIGEISSNGVPAPIPPAGMSEVEADSPARRSPQVRAAQQIGSARPDLLPKQSANGALLR
jgi:hypothetical protein